MSSPASRGTVAAIYSTLLPSPPSLIFLVLLVVRFIASQTWLQYALSSNIGPNRTLLVVRMTRSREVTTLRVVAILACSGKTSYDKRLLLRPFFSIANLSQTTFNTSSQLSLKITH